MRLISLPPALAIVCLAVCPAESAQPSSAVVEAIEVEGLNRMTRPAFLHALGVERGAPYDLRALRSRHDDLWDSTIFEDIEFEARSAPSGNRILVYRVREAPDTRSVTIDEVAGVTSAAVVSRLAELGLRFKIGIPPDMRNLPLAEQAVRDMLGERGYPGATVESEVTRLIDSMVSIHFGVTLASPAGSAPPGGTD